jgi:hypothetical protein
MPQGRRTRVLEGLRRKHLRVLVATDVAARGIDVPTISHVINYGLPMKAEDYVHRIGRTGRAGRQGLAITLAERRDVSMIKRIQQFTTQPIPVASIAGLEPQQPEPRIYAGRPEGVRPAGGKPFGKPAFRGAGGARPTGGKPFAPRQDGFPPRHEGFAPRGGEGFAPRQDGFPPRGRAPHEAGARTDRAPFERKAGGGAGFGKPQRPRQGGFTR